MIILSKKEIPLNFRLLYGFLGVWNMSINAFILPFGMMSLTFHDVTTIVGLPVDGDKIPFLHDVLDSDLGFPVYKKNNAYSILINTFNRGNDPVGEIEHKAFLLFWICCFFICTSSMVVVGELHPRSVPSSIKNI